MALTDPTYSILDAALDGSFDASLCENTGILSACRKSFLISPVSRGIAR
jgi:hypothetical protein